MTTPLPDESKRQLTAFDPLQQGWLRPACCRSAEIRIVSNGNGDEYGLFCAECLSMIGTIIGKLEAQ